jgi:hypothetical protein
MEMFNVLMGKLDDCKKQIQMLNKTLDDYEMKCSEEDLDGDFMIAVYNRDIENEKEYEKFYKDAIINLIKK